MQRDKQHQRKVLLSSFHLSGPIHRINPQTQNIDVSCSAAPGNYIAQWLIWGLFIWRGGGDRRKSWIKPLKETNLNVAQAFFDP